MTEPLLTAAQVAEILGVSKRYVWRLARDGELRRVEVGKYVRFDPVDVAEFIEQRKQGPRRSRARVEQPRQRLGGTPRATPRRRARVRF